MLKSDYSNGLFSLASDDIAPVDEDSVTIPVLVVRERGLYSEVMVFWKVTLNGTNVLAADDFEYSTGFILFEANEAQKVQFSLYLPPSPISLILSPLPSLSLLLSLLC